MNVTDRHRQTPHDGTDYAYECTSKLRLTHMKILNSVINANSAFHPYGVDKSSTNLPGWGEGGAVTFVGWQVTLCDPIDKWHPVVLR